MFAEKIVLRDNFVSYSPIKTLILICEESIRVRHNSFSNSIPYYYKLLQNC